MSKQEEMILHYERLIRKTRCLDKEDEPVSCRRCPYYRPEFKYRSCFYTKCLYGKDKQVFRKNPLRRDKFSKKRR